MTGVWQHRLGRRLGVVVLIVLAVGLGAVTVQVAGQWRAAEAPLDGSPVSIDAIGEAAQLEQDRAAALSGQVGEVAAQVDTLRAALSSAHDNASSDATHVKALQQQLSKSTGRLKALQRQLQAAQDRLAQLNAAAARQSALNGAARSSGGGGGGGEEGDDRGDDDD